MIMSTEIMYESNGDLLSSDAKILIIKYTKVTFGIKKIDLKKRWIWTSRVNL